MTLAPYKILRIPQVKATDDFIIQTSETVSDDSEEYTRAFFVCNGRNRRGSAYKYAATGNILWIADATHGIMLWNRSKRPPNIITITCSDDTMSTQVANETHVSIATAPAPKANLKTQAGLDMSCLLIGVFFETDEYIPGTMRNALLFDYLNIQTSRQTISIGQDSIGRFYDKNTGRRIEELDTRETTFVYRED